MLGHGAFAVCILKCCFGKKEKKKKKEMRDGYFWHGFKLQIDEMQLPCHLEENIVSVGECVQQGIMVSHAQ